jgi:1-acyl-sn-glycerol-3-phosphate acyltransferase
MSTLSGPGRFPPPFYSVIATAVRYFVTLVYGLRVTGREHVPRQGGCVVASNHVSAWDPPVVGVSTPREIHFMAKRELFRPWLLRRVVRGLRAFPVDRTGQDVGAIKEALRRLQRGYAIGIFFEGTRSAHAAGPAHQGAAFLAQRADVPLVPAAIWREGRRFRVAFGPPLQPTGRGREEAARLTAELRRAVDALLPSRT